MANISEDDALELIKKLARIGEEEFLTFSWPGSVICFWCGVVEPMSWGDHDDDCPGKMARMLLAPELLDKRRQNL